VALGDVDGDGLREIVTGAGRGGGPHVRIFKTDGALWGGSFFAYDSSERGGVNVAVGDVDADGRQEIVAGSGRGSIPRVRVYDGRGILKSEFVLSNAPAPLGVKPIVSDIDGDGKEEFITGTTDGRLIAVGTGSDGKGTIKWSLPLGSALGNPVVADIDGDGSPEILVVTGDGSLVCVGSTPHNTFA